MRNGKEGRDERQPKHKGAKNDVKEWREEINRERQDERSNEREL